MTHAAPAVRTRPSRPEFCVNFAARVVHAQHGEHCQNNSCDLAFEAEHTFARKGSRRPTGCKFALRGRLVQGGRNSTEASRLANFRLGSKASQANPRPWARMSATPRKRTWTAELA